MNLERATLKRKKAFPWLKKKGVGKNKEQERDPRETARADKSILLK